jgi:hypothetical protein
MPPLGAAWPTPRTTSTANTAASKSVDCYGNASKRDGRDQDDCFVQFNISHRDMSLCLVGSDLTLMFESYSSEPPRNCCSEIDADGSRVGTSAACPSHASSRKAATANGVGEARALPDRCEYRNRARMAAITVQRLSVCSLDFHYLRRLDRAKLQDQVIKRVESPRAENHVTHSNHPGCGRRAWRSLHIN